MGPNRLVVLVLAAGFLALSSCGAPPSDVGADAEDVAATPPSSPSEGRGCAEFCDIAAPKGCPATGDCVTVCEAQRALSPGCGERFDALLACAAPEVNGSCGLPKQRSQVAGLHCDQEGTHYLFCTANDPLARTYAWWTTPPVEPDGGHLARYRDGVWEATMNSAVLGYSRSECDDATGECACFHEGEQIGTCQTLLLFSHQAPAETCCGDLLSQP
jgi:hypothetical protein